jgi:hypothetical protein
MRHEKESTEMCGNADRAAEVPGRPSIQGIQAAPQRAEAPLSDPEPTTVPLPAGGQERTTDASDLLIPRTRQFTVGFVLTDPPRAKSVGSGVLLRVGGVSGILTCAHVAERYRKREEIGLLRFSRDGIDQRQKLILGETTTLYIEENIGEPPWSNPKAIDLAFTRLPERDVATLSAMCVFLNWEQNVKKFAGGEPKYDTHVDAVFGLVGEFSGKPVTRPGLVTTPMQGVLTPGHIISRNDGLLTLECMDYNITKLPTSFGGSSGGELWRMYLSVSADKSYAEIETRLCGIASFQLNATEIMCQGFERIEQALVPAINKHFGT